MQNEIIASVEAEFKKAQNESLKAKAKEILKRKAEAEKTAKLCDMELKKLFEDAEAGIA